MKTEYDMSQAKRGAVVSPQGKTRITIYLDDAVLAGFRARAEAQGKGYQTLINEALSVALADDNTPVTISTLRKILREELHAA
jgi:uncharacterized protein (DUF4415 family)